MARQGYEKLAAKRGTAQRMVRAMLALACALACAAALALPAVQQARADDASTTLSEARTVRVACNINDSLYLDGNGKPAGYCAGYLEQLAWNCNWVMEYVPGSWSQSVQGLEDGTIDLLFPTQKTDERLASMGFSDVIGGYQPLGLYAAADAPIYLDDYAAFDGKRIAVSPDSSNEEALSAYAAKNGFSYVAVPIDSVQDKIDALAAGQVDLIAFSTLNQVPNGKIVGMLDYAPFYYCTRADDRQLLQELNDGMRSVMANNPTVAADAYEAMLKGEGAYSFTRQENEAIQAASVVRLGLYDNSLPLFGTDSQGQGAGIYADIVEAIRQKSGLNIEIVPISRDRFLYDALDDGTVDFVMSTRDLPYLADDISNYLVSESIMDYVTVAVTKPDFNFEASAHPAFALTNARRYWEDDIYQMYPGATIKYYGTVKDCLAAVQDGACDATLLNTWEYNYQSKNPRFSGMLEWENLRRTSQLVVGTTKAADMTLLSVIEKSIDQISAAEKDSLVTSNLNMAYDDYTFFDGLAIMKGALMAAGAVVAILVASLVFYLCLRKRHIRELEESNRQLEQANRVKTQFLGRMSHELRTPLNAIAGYTANMQQSLAEHGLDQDQAQRDLAAIERASHFQLGIINDLLDIQKIESGKMAVTAQEVDAELFMSDIVDMVRPEAEGKGVAFTYERLTHESETYQLDGIHFKQALFNVLHNAIKFTPPGGWVKLTSEMVSQDEGTALMRFVVADNGVGMSDDFRQNQLFTRFAQEYHDSTSPYEGCGNGLAITSELLHLMGGSIACDSAKGVGSTFTITVPVQVVSKRRRQRRKQQPLPCDLGGITVLVCEDNQMNQDMEKTMLERLGATVELADDGAIGCQMFAESEPGHYSIVLMDIRMPNMDGLEAARAIRALNRPDAAVPIVAVSANAFEEDVQASLDAGMNEHLAKPVNPRILREAILRHCRGEAGPAGHE